MTESTAASPDESHDSARTWLVVCLTAVAAGVVIGFVGGAFRWCLQRAENLGVDLAGWAHRVPGPGWMLPIAVAAACAALAAVIVRWEPLAAGSGIPHVEA